MKKVFVTFVCFVAFIALAHGQEGFKFKSGVDLVNVTATVTDDDGRFVSGLTQDDFRVYDNSTQQEITHFSSDRVPVSLGLALDTSGSMTPEKMSAARSAIDRFIYDLLGRDDELFFEHFANRADIIQSWTTDRRLISRAAQSVSAGGGTAIYDAVADALPLAQRGKNQKKALLLISDGNDTNSGTSIRELQSMIRESEVLVYALGVDGTGESRRSGPVINLPPLPIPFPIPGRRPRYPMPGSGGGGGGTNGGWMRTIDERVNADALRAITDDTGGRTEIVRGFGDLDGATERIADELSKQYYLGYAAPGEKDGKYHSIRVELKDKRLHVRARKGYVAS